LSGHALSFLRRCLTRAPRAAAPATSDTDTSLVAFATILHRALAIEVMVPTPAVRNLIREDKVNQLYSVMQVGQDKVGMQTMNQSLATLEKTRQVSIDTALSASSMPDELRDLVARGVGVIDRAGMQRPEHRSPSPRR
jgi:twitching motility protein PilT